MSKVFADVFDDFGVSKALLDPIKILRGSFAGTDFARWWRENFVSNACPGQVKIISWVIMIILAALLYFFTGKEFLFKLSIQSQKFVARRNGVVRILFGGAVRIILAVVFYIAQVLVIVMYQIGYISIRSIDLTRLKVTTVDVRNPKCSSAQDPTLNKAGDYLILITSAVIFVWYVSLFAGRSAVGPKAVLGTLVMAPFALLFAWPLCTASGGSVRGYYKRIGFGRWWFNLFYLLIFSVKRVVFLTLGIWTNDLARAFEVLDIAERFDDDPLDDDNKVEDVLEVYGRARGVLWNLWPGCVVLAKVAEMANAPTVFVVSPLLKPKTPRWKRSFRWIWNATRFALTISVVFKAQKSLLYLLFASLLPIWANNIFDEAKDAMKKVVPYADLTEADIAVLKQKKAINQARARELRAKGVIAGNQAAGLSPDMVGKVEDAGDFFDPADGLGEGKKKDKSSRGRSKRNQEKGKRGEEMARLVEDEDVDDAAVAAVATSRSKKAESSASGSGSSSSTASSSSSSSSSASASASSSSASSSSASPSNSTRSSSSVSLTSSSDDSSTNNSSSSNSSSSASDASSSGTASDESNTEK
jgi:hypothetical protein